MADEPINYVQGRFLSELKNRFLCSVQIDGEAVTCYIPSSCRLSNFIDLSGKSVLLKAITTPNSRTPYAVYAVKYGRRYILLNLAQANRIIEAQIYRRCFSFLGKRKEVMHEYRLDNYKTDLYIKDTKTMIEIKSLLAFDNQAVFPTVYSERAINQLKHISKLIDDGYKACYMLVSLNPDVREIQINSQIEEFYKLFMKCTAKGMLYCGFTIKLVNQSPQLGSVIKVLIE